MNKDILIRILFVVFGVLSIIALFTTYLIGYIFGPLAFNPVNAKPHYIIDMFLYKEYFIIGLIHLAFLTTAILSFLAATNLNYKKKAIICYIFALFLLLLQILWSNLYINKF